MNKNIFKALALITLTSSIVSCVPKDMNLAQIQNENESISVDFSNKYLYINTDNSLCLKDKTSEVVNILNENVLEFKNSNDYLAFISKESSNKALKVCNIKTGRVETLKDYYIEDFLVKDTFLFYIEDNSICKLDLDSKEKEIIINAGTNDIVLNTVTDKVLIYSYLEKSTPTTFSYNLDNGNISKIAEKATNLTVLNDVIYGLDDNFNIFKVNKDNSLDTISNYPVLKFTINDDYLIYIDVKGSLITLDKNGTKRVISDSAMDFKRIEDKLYYISSAKENTIFETQLTGRHKNSILSDSNSLLNFNSIK